MTCLADAGARADPLVVGVDELGEIVVSEVLSTAIPTPAIPPRGGEGRGDERRPAGARYPRGPPGRRRLTRAAGLRARADREARGAAADIDSVVIVAIPPSLCAAAIPFLAFVRRDRDSF